MSIIIYNQKISIIIPANIRLGEDVLKTSWKRLEDVFSVIFFCLPRRLENVLKTSWTHNCKTSCNRILNTSWKRLEDIIARRLANTSWTRLEDVLKTSWRRLARHLEDVLKTSWKTKSVTLKTSWRRLEDVLENKKCLLGWMSTKFYFSFYVFFNNSNY